LTPNGQWRLARESVMFTRKISRRSFLSTTSIFTLWLGLDWKRVVAYAARMGPKEDYPTVIIGAGLGGLCCGAYLAKQGIPVTVVEQRDRPGGYAASFDRAGGKYRFEVSLHGMYAKNNVAARILEDLGVLKELEFVQLSEVYHLSTPDHKISVPQRDPEEYIRILSRHFPAEEEGIRRFVQEIVGIAREADELHQRGMCPSLLFPFKYPKMFRVRNKTVADLLNGYIKDPRLNTILASLWDFHGLPPSKLAGLYYAVAKGECLRNGTYYVKERSSDLSFALARVIEREGGQILYGTLAEEILIKNGAVKGVMLSRGKVLPARAVVSNASAPSTFGSMLPKGALPMEFSQELNTFVPSLSSFIVWLGLKREIRGKIPFCGIQTVTRRGPEEDYQSCLRGDVEKIPLRVSLYDNIYEGYSKPGTSTVRVFCLTGYGPWQKFEKDYKAGRKEAYRKEKERWVNTLISRAEKEILPGLSSMIEVREAASPLTNWRFTRNPGGAIFGFEQTLNHAYIDRKDNRTPIKGLYLASAWGVPGGGFWGVLLTGQMTFEEMMEDWGSPISA